MYKIYIINVSPLNESPEVNMKTFNDIDNSLIKYWNMHNIHENDMYCRKCGKILIDLDETSNVIVKFHKSIYFVQKNNNKLNYTESSQNRWCVKGRELSGKTYFRHLCWDCLKKEIPYAIEHNDELQLISSSRLKKWIRMLANGKIQRYIDKFPPPAWNSPIWWFRLIFDMTEDELNVERIKFDTASLGSFIRRYGENEGKKQYDEYVKLQAKAGCTLEYFIEKLGKDAGIKRYEELCKNKGVSKKNCIEKYGKDIGEKFFNRYCNRQAYAGNTLEYFIEKYGKDVGERKYNEVCSQKSLTLANFIRKYGKELGTEKYKSYINRAQFGFSKISQELFDVIDKTLGDYAKNSYYYTKNFEYELVISNINGKQKIAKLDYCLGKKVIEFNGDFWHANPLVYNANDNVCINNNYQLAKDIWERDAKRKEMIEALGFKVLVVWESDYVSDPEHVVDVCVKFLKDE